jgi:hypothetical protein
MSIVNPSLEVKASRADSSLVEGVFPDDLLIKSTLEHGLKELRENQWELSLVFAALTKDPVTFALYGEKERQRAIEWFNNTQISVLWDLRLAADKIPSVSYSIQSCEQTEETLADAHYDMSEDRTAEWEAVTAQLQPNYIPATGLVTIDESALQGPITEGMMLVTKTGTQYAILEVASINQFFIAKNLITDLNGSYVKTGSPSLVSGIESDRFKETLKIGCHVSGDPITLTYLHSIVFYILLKYRKTLLEARGFERSTISAGPYMRDDRFQIGADQCFTRYINLVGTVTMTWAATQVKKIQTVTGSLDAVSAGTNPDRFIAEPGNDDPAWLSEDMNGAL